MGPLVGVPHSGGCLSMRNLSTALVELREAFKSEATKGAGDEMEKGDLGEGGEGDKNAQNMMYMKFLKN